MAVFWFGWAKKLKNIFTKQQADQYYLQKELPNRLQIVKGSVDFYKNVVIKQKGYVDSVDTNAPTSMINKRYLDNSKTYTLFWQSNDRVFNNLDSTDINHTFTTIDTTVPWILKYDRIVKNGNVYEGSFNYSFMIPALNEAIFSTNRWYFRASSNTFEEGSRVGIIIKRKTENSIMLKIQIWEGTKAIKNIKLYKPQQ